METLRQDGTRVITLLASRSTDWETVKTDQCPLMSRRNVRRYELSPHREEAWRAVEKLVARGVLSIAPEHEANVIAEVENIPFGERYFHRVIEVASDERFRPTSVIVEEALEEAGDAPDARMFERFYAYVCLPGMVGLGLPHGVARLLMPEESESAQALAFGQAMASPPIRVEEHAYHATHEQYAVEFVARRELPQVLDAVVELFVEHAEVGDFVGSLLDLLRARGLSDFAMAAWDRIADRIKATHWEACSGHALTAAWGSLFYHCRRTELALRVTGVAVKKLPHSAQAHSNYAVLLRQQGEPDEARKHYKEALRINPEYADAHNNYANLLKEQGETGEARKHYKEALRINPEYAAAAANWADLELSQGDIVRGVDLAGGAARLGSLPDRGLGIPTWFAEHTEELVRIVESNAQPPDRRGGALAFLLGLKHKKVSKLVEKWVKVPEFADAAQVCLEIVGMWREAVKGADPTSGRDPSDES